MAYSISISISLPNKIFFFHFVVFQPFNVKAKLIMTLKPRQQNFEKPMFHLTIDLEHISLNLTRAQVS
jgi:hypothetical protein